MFTQRSWFIPGCASVTPIRYRYPLITQTILYCKQRCAFVFQFIFYCFNFFTNEVNNSYLFMCNSIVNLITFIHTFWFIKAQLASHCLCWMPLFLDGEWRCTTLTFGKVDILFKNAYNLVLAKAFKEEMGFLFFMSDLISLSSHHNWLYIFWWWSSNASIVNMDLCIVWTLLCNV